VAWWFSAGFTQNFGNQLPGGSESADEVNARALPWLRTNGKSDKWFMHLHYWDVHTPYAAPQQYFNRMAGKPGPAFPDKETVARHAHDYYGPRTARDWWFHTNWQNSQTGRTARMPRGNPDTFENYMGFIDGHDADIAYVDEKIGEVLAELDRLGIRDDTAIIVSADHSESIGELGMYFEHGNCCEGTTRIPLIVNWPGLNQKRSMIEGLIYNVDLPPTVLELLGVKAPENWDGASFAAALRGKSFPGRDHLVLGTGIYSFQRAVRTPRYRLIRTIHPGLLPYDPLYLFDMQKDPNQTRNLSAELPGVVAELDHLLLEWLCRYTCGPAGARDPFQEQLRAGVDPDLYCRREIIEQRLRDLGRDDQLADLRRRRDPKPAPVPW
jgi:arylsulfatase A-like enzyme